MQFAKILPETVTKTSDLMGYPVSLRQRFNVAFNGTASRKPLAVGFNTSLMENSANHDVTHLLIAWSDGDNQALGQLLPLVYKELRQIADRYLRRERADHTLQATALVHEAYFKLVDQTRVRWQNRAHFFGIAAQAMRRILIDHARNYQTEKRAGVKLSLDDEIDISDQRAGELIALDDALNALAEIDPQKKPHR